MSLSVRVNVKTIYLFNVSSRGHADAEIEAVFAKYDVDGDRILDEDECKRMQEDLEGQKVTIDSMALLILPLNSKKTGPIPPYAWPHD